MIVKELEVERDAREPELRGLVVLNLLYWPGLFHFQNEI